MINCCNINCKRFIPALLAVVVFVFVTDFLVHGCWLKNAYSATSTLWRTDEDMKAHMGWMMAGQFIGAFFLTLIFAKGYEGKGIIEGLRFGLLIGGFSLAHCFIQYSVTPIPCSLLGAWAISGVGQAVGASVIASLIYKKP